MKKYVLYKWCSLERKMLPVLDKEGERIAIMIYPTALPLLKEATKEAWEWDEVTDD